MSLHPHVRLELYRHKVGTLGRRLYRRVGEFYQKVVGLFRQTGRSSTHQDCDHLEQEYCELCPLAAGEVTYLNLSVASVLPELR
jgi:hypothetical protein